MLHPMQIIVRFLLIFGLVQRQSMDMKAVIAVVVNKNCFKT